MAVKVILSIGSFAATNDESVKNVLIIRGKNKIVEITTNSIYAVLNNLIEQKSKRDNMKFTSAQLAHAIHVKRSIVQRLLHPDIGKRVTNPKIETLIKIVEYFRSQGFDVSIDSFLVTKRPAINVQEQAIGVLSMRTSIPIYSLNDPKALHLGTIDVSIAEHQGALLALLTEEDIKPMFKRGSIFIVDPRLTPEDSTLVAVRIGGQSKVLIKKYALEGNAAYLKPIEGKEKAIKITVGAKCEIMGVVIQVNAKT